MTMRMFNLKWFAVVFLLVALAVVMSNGLPEEESKPFEGDIWYHPEVLDEAGMPINDCGRNYAFKLEFVLPNGDPCQTIIGVASEKYVKRVTKTFENESNIWADSIDLALDYIEKVVWKFGGYAPK
ncbi:MAG: hypothetical protein HY868_26195 [Chloroflexi bacterium]|nr:hypothetical protein [Chloroflexota bacterium]